MIAFSRSTEHGWKAEVRLPYRLCCGGPRAWGSGRDFPKQSVHCPARTWLTELYHCDLSGCAGDRRLTWLNWISTCSNCNLHVSCTAWQKKHLLQLNRDQLSESSLELGNTDHLLLQFLQLLRNLPAPSSTICTPTFHGQMATTTQPCRTKQWQGVKACWKWKLCFSAFIWSFPEGHNRV